MNGLSLRIRSVDPVGSPAALHLLTVSVADAVFAARDIGRMIPPEWAGTERTLVLMAMEPRVEESDAEAGVDAEDGFITFSGEVLDVEAGHEGFVGELDCGVGTVRFDAGTTVRPGEHVAVTTETVHVVGVGADEPMADF